MSLPIKLISTDFDGTIYAEFENPPVAKKFTDLVGELQAQGVKWVINTGRDMPGLMEALARARLPVRPDFLVLVEREIHFHAGARYLGFDDWNDRCGRAHRDIFRQLRRDIPQLVEWINARFKATVYEDPYSPFCLIADKPADAEAIHVYLDAYCQGVPPLTVVRNDVYARLAHADYNKGTSLAEIARRQGIGPKHIFAAGDHLNDLPMLVKRHAGWLATPANAITPVKESVLRAGGFVSRYRHGLGVVEALRRFLDDAKGR
jgi:hydroxymethylpyrimidine pyrophosphatase-like HAD family hydrolase